MSSYNVVPWKAPVSLASFSPSLVVVTCAGHWRGARFVGQEELGNVVGLGSAVVQRDLPTGVNLAVPLGKTAAGPPTHSAAPAAIWCLSGVESKLTPTATQF